MQYEVYLTLANRVRRFRGSFPERELAEEKADKLLRTLPGKHSAVVEVFYGGEPILIASEPTAKLKAL